jgi:hypothetical protein
VAFQAAVWATQEPHPRQETGWKPVFHDRLEAYPTPHRGVSRLLHRSIPLSNIPLSNIPLSNIPLSNIPLSNIPLSNIPLSNIPLSLFLCVLCASAFHFIGLPSPRTRLEARFP